MSYNVHVMSCSLLISEQEIFNHRTLMESTTCNNSTVEGEVYMSSPGGGTGNGTGNNTSGMSDGSEKKKKKKKPTVNS